VCVDLPVFEMASPFGHSASSTVVIEEVRSPRGAPPYAHSSGPRSATTDRHRRP
jgi:hypothetical protein